MSRVTIATLRASIVTINDWLEKAGHSVRLEEGGRNGYQAVDEYSVHADGSRKGSGCNRNVCCGSSRECVAAAYDHWNACCRRADRAALADKSECGDHNEEWPDDGCTGDAECRCENGCEG
jgi:hypothetical protein